MWFNANYNGDLYWIFVKNTQNFWVPNVKTVWNNYTRTKVPSFYEQIWQFTLENNHELQIIADFIVII